MVNWYQNKMDTHEFIVENIMIISEKQITHLIQIAYRYLRVLDQNEDSLTKNGKNNKIFVAHLLQTISDQQSEELKEFK